MTTNRCVSCLYRLLRQPNATRAPQLRCAHPDAQPVASVSRRKGQACGPTAQLWEPRPPHMI